MECDRFHRRAIRGKLIAALPRRYGDSHVGVCSAAPGPLAFPSDPSCAVWSGGRRPRECPDRRWSTGTRSSRAVSRRPGLPPSSLLPVAARTYRRNRVADKSIVGKEQEGASLERPVLFGDQPSSKRRFRRVRTGHADHPRSLNCALSNGTIGTRSTRHGSRHRDIWGRRPRGQVRPRHPASRPRWRDQPLIDGLAGSSAVGGDPIRRTRDARAGTTQRSTARTHPLSDASECVRRGRLTRVRRRQDRIAKLQRCELRPY